MGAQHRLKGEAFQRRQQQRQFDRRKLVPCNLVAYLQPDRQSLIPAQRLLNVDRAARLLESRLGIWPSTAKPVPQAPSPCRYRHFSTSPARAFSFRALGLGLQPVALQPCRVPDQEIPSHLRIEQFQQCRLPGERVMPRALSQMPGSEPHLGTPCPTRRLPPTSIAIAPNRLTSGLDLRKACTA